MVERRALDQRLQDAVALERLVHPMETGTEMSERVLMEHRVAAWQSLRALAEYGENKRIRAGALGLIEKYLRSHPGVVGKLEEEMRGKQ